MGRPATELKLDYDVEKGEKVKLIKLFGLAAVAAIAAMAFVGATSASAMTTTLCKINQLPCSEANQYAFSTMKLAIKAEATNPELVSSSGTIKCEKSVAKGEITELSELPNTLIDLLGEITELTFTNCKLGIFNCTVKSVGLPDMVALLQIEGTMNGNLVTNNAKAEVSGCLTCTFGGEVSLEAQGGEMGNIVAEDILVKESGGFGCPGEAKWKAKYLVLEPSGAIYVSN